MADDDRADHHRNVVRVIEAGAALGVEVVPRSLPGWHEDGTGCRRCDRRATVGQIVKSLIFARRRRAGARLRERRQPARRDEARVGSRRIDVRSRRRRRRACRDRLSPSGVCRRSVTTTAAAGVHRSRSAAVRRGVGSRRNMARRVRAVAGSAGVGEWRSRDRSAPQRLRGQVAESADALNTSGSIAMNTAVERV